MVLIARPWDRAVCPAAPLIEVELGGSVRIPASVPAGLAAAGLKALSLRVVVEPPPMSPGRYKRFVNWRSVVLSVTPWDGNSGRKGKADRQIAQREIRVKIGVVVQNVPPPRSHVIVLAQEFLITIRHQVQIPGGRLVMIELRQRRPHDQVPALAEPQAQIHVIERDRQVLTVESTDLEKYIPPDRETGGGHRREILLQCSAAEVAGIIGPPVAMKVSGDPRQSQYDAAMLHAPIRIE
jgi:hypothetical protein